MRSQMPRSVPRIWGLWLVESQSLAVGGKLKNSPRMNLAVMVSPPVLLVVAEKTDPYFIDGARKAGNAWPRARLEVIPGADHLLALEAAELFNRLIVDFFASVDAAR